jgi:hypothetical protein
VAEPGTPSAPGPPELPALLVDVEAAVQEALATGNDEGLCVLGHGEISLVVGWPAHHPVQACKRLPLFPSEEAARRYARVLEDYLDRLERRGTFPVPTSFHTVAPQRDGRCAGYVVQPVLPAGTLGPEVLRGAEPDPSHPLVTGVVSAVCSVVDEHTGLDAQISNWSLSEGRLHYFDVTTPIVLDDEGRLAFDVGVMTAAFPWVMRAPLRRWVAPRIAAAYCDRRTVLVDLAANLHKERLAHWIPAVLEAANREVTDPITEEEAHRYYRSDARLWEQLLRLRRADRWWQRTVRRRSYPFLLPRSTAR